MAVERQVQYDTFVKLLILIKVAIKQPGHYFPLETPFVLALLFKLITAIAIFHVMIRMVVFQDWRKAYGFPVIALFSIFALLSLVVHHTRKDISFTLAFYSVLCLFLFCTIPSSFPQELVEREIRVLLAGLAGIGFVCLFPALYGVLFLNTGAPMPISWVKIGGNIYLQQNPNRLGMAFLVLGVLAWAYILQAWGEKKKEVLFWIIVLLLSYFIIFRLGTRACFFSLFAGCFVYSCLLFLCYMRSLSRKAFLLSFGGCVVVSGFLLVGIIFMQQLINSSTSHMGQLLFNTTGRIEIWKDSISLICRKPWVGWTSLQVRNQEDVAALFFKSVTVNAHNCLLDLALFCGIPAALSFFSLLLVSLIKPTVMLFQKKHWPFLSPLFCLTFTLLFVVVLHGMVESDIRYHTSSTFYLFFIPTGLLLYLIGCLKEGR